MKILSCFIQIMQQKKQHNFFLQIPDQQSKHFQGRHDQYGCPEVTHFYTRDTIFHYAFLMKLFTKTV